MSNEVKKNKPVVHTSYHFYANTYYLRKDAAKRIEKNLWPFSYRLNEAYEAQNIEDAFSFLNTLFSNHNFKSRYGDDIKIVRKVYSFSDMEKLEDVCGVILDPKSHEFQCNWYPDLRKALEERKAKSDPSNTSTTP